MAAQLRALMQRQASPAVGAVVTGRSGRLLSARAVLHMLGQAWPAGCPIDMHLRHDQSRHSPFSNCGAATPFVSLCGLPCVWAALHLMSSFRMDVVEAAHSALGRDVPAGNMWACCHIRQQTVFSETSPLVNGCPTPLLGRPSRDCDVTPSVRRLPEPH